MSSDTIGPETRTASVVDLDNAGYVQPVDRLGRIEAALTRIETLLKLMAPPQTPPGPTGMRVYDAEGNLIRW